MALESIETIECEGCAKQSNKDFLAEMLEAGKRWERNNQQSEIAPQPINENSSSDFLAEMLEAGKKWSGKSIKPEHNKPDTKKWTDEQKMQACPRNGGSGYVRGKKKANIRKMPSGDTLILPRYCNICEGCYKHHAKELKERMDYMDAYAEHHSKENGGGHWRKAIVEDDKEVKALKKRISRNQDGRPVEFAAEVPDHNEVWTYVDNDEPEPEKYGEEANLDDIDFDAVYKRNRQSGKKFSTGKAFKSSATPSSQETIRIIVPEIVVDIVDADKAERIIRETNYIQEANDATDAQIAYTDEFKHILIELEKEGVEVLAVDNSYYNIAPERLLEDWNRKCKYWMSINAPLDSNDSGAKVDIANRLYFPDKEKEAHLEPLI
jgi:hypothetical protein